MNGCPMSGTLKAGSTPRPQALKPVSAVTVEPPMPRPAELSEEAAADGFDSAEMCSRVAWIRKAIGLVPTDGQGPIKHAEPVEPRCEPKATIEDLPAIRRMVALIPSG